MSKMGKYFHGLQEDAAHYWGAMDRARGKALSDFTYTINPHSHW